MAPPIAVANEYYETNFFPETTSDPHPHPPLRHSKIIMVSTVMADRSLIELKWPSIASLAFFFVDRNEILPAFDEECTLTSDDATRLIKDRIDTLDLCYLYGNYPTFWLHNQGIVQLCSAMVLMELDYLHQQMRGLLKVDQFYAVDFKRVPITLQEDLVGFARVAWVCIAGSDPVLGPYVQVRIPSIESLHEFMMSSESCMLPKFDRVFYVSLYCARSFLGRMMPLELCLRMRMRRGFWMNEFEEDCLNFLVTADVYAPDPDADDLYAPDDDDDDDVYAHDDGAGADANANADAGDAGADRG